MSTALWYAFLFIASAVLSHMLERWRWSGCRCGRERLPWLWKRHEKEWLMWVRLVIAAACAIGWTFTEEGLVWPLLMGVFAVLEARVVREHRKGKRSILGRLSGRVVVNAHGRLAVER